MTKVYKEVPENFEDIKNYIVEEDKSINTLILSEKLFFYDTCSIVTQSKSIYRKKIIEFILKVEGTIILTRTILMELTDNDNLLFRAQVDYFKEIYEYGINIVLLNEEDILAYLNKCIDIKIEDANKLLGQAIINVSKQKGLVYEIKQLNSRNIINRMLDNTGSSRTELYTDFFKYARSMKVSKDNLGEELMFICFIVLSRVPGGKLFFLSNDLNSRAAVIELNNHIENLYDRREPYQMTSVSLFYKMYKDGIIKHKETMKEMFDNTTVGNIKAYYMGKYDIELRFKSFEKDELIEKIFTEDDFKVIY